MWKHMAPLFIMFEKLTKRLTTKATDGAVESAKETLNDKLEHYSGIIKFGLTFGVIAFGSKVLTRKDQPQQVYPSAQAPIVINNYYGERRSDYEQKENTRANQNWRQHRDLCRHCQPHAADHTKWK